MAAELKTEFGVEAELVEDAGGVFDVVVDEQLVYSKHAQENRFPVDGEVVGIINQRDA